nr:DNA-dependent metalloprotease SPRTN-like [Lytechinus pictus]
MDATSDAELARLLQFQFDSETATEIAVIEPASTNDRRFSGTKPIGIVDERWELIDPNPDVRALFLQFNDQFFWGRLAGVEVRWSPRMTLCAGVCCYEGYGGLCSVRLSQPLLKLRPRKDLVETLLHEMIHAYLFVTQNNKDHDGHGPEFCKHMNRINAATGTHISIYHTFHDEVDSYRQHWWRCDGPCRQRKPYFGYVKRSMNRAPSPRDTWWGEHQRSCGGTFTKVKEPEGYGQKKGGKKDHGESSEVTTTKDQQGIKTKDIRNFIPFSGKGHSLGNPTTSSSNNSSSSSTSGSSVSDKRVEQPKERKKSSESKDISSFFTKKWSDDPANTTKSSSSSSGPPSHPNNSSAVGGFKKKPRFTPVVATASGRVVSDSDDAGTAEGKTCNSGQTMKGKGSIPNRTGKFIPVVSAVGRKEGVHSSKNLGDSLSSSKSLVGSDIRRHGGEQDNTSEFLGKKAISSAKKGDRGRTPINSVQVVRTRDRIGGGSSEGKRKKRARLADLQAMFDSDSDDDEAMNRSSKCPRVSHGNSYDDDSDAILVEDGVSSRTNSGSNKENSPSLHNDRGGIYIQGDSDDDDDVIAQPIGSGITNGIWKDLSHLSSGSSGYQVTGNRRFGRVTPPLYGKSKGKSLRGSNIGQTPPQSSFCEHPWQTAARESDRKASTVTVEGAVISLTAEDDVGLVEEVGPKKVPCPVCNLQIEERKINSHLDTCLTFNCDALFS